jgi:hypothetical protein
LNYCLGIGSSSSDQALNCQKLYWAFGNLTKRPPVGNQRTNKPSRGGLLVILVGPNSEINDLKTLDFQGKTAFYGHKIDKTSLFITRKKTHDVFVVSDKIY